MALKVGVLTWEQGLVMSGNGILTGIAGNGYALHCLARTYKSLAEKNES
jgi:hypothetical protein